MHVLKFCILICIKHIPKIGLKNKFATAIVSSDQINMFYNIKENSIAEHQRSYDMFGILGKTYVTLYIFMFIYKFIVRS